MEDGRHWELSRFYKDFYDLQINLIQEFPLEAGNVKGYERSLPYMPGPVTYVTDNISNGRRANLDDYIKNLLKLGPHITSGYLVRKFFAPREGDYEIEPDADGSNAYRLSATSAQSTSPSQGGASSQSSAQNLSLQQQSHQSRHQPAMSLSHASAGHLQPHQHLRSQSEQHSGPPSMMRQNSALTQASASSAASSTQAFKIKVWFEEDNCVVLRMPPQFRFPDLHKKLKERRRLERGLAPGPENGGPGGEDEGELVIEYKDEGDGEYYRIASDADLQVALERCPKLTLMVGVEPR